MSKRIILRKLLLSDIPEGCSHVLHPGQSPSGSLDHERGTPHERHDSGPLVDAERGDSRCQHSCTKVNILFSSETSSRCFAGDQTGTNAETSLQCVSRKIRWLAHCVHGHAFAEVLFAVAGVLYLLMKRDVDRQFTTPNASEPIT